MLPINGGPPNPDENGYRKTVFIVAIMPDKNCDTTAGDVLGGYNGLSADGKIFP